MNPGRSSPLGPGFECQAQVRLGFDWLVFVRSVLAGADVSGEADSNRAPLLLLFQGVRRPEPLKIKGE